jgi:hypothetical protein
MLTFVREIERHGQILEHNVVIVSLGTDSQDQRREFRSGIFRFFILFRWSISTAHNVAITTFRSNPPPEGLQ